MVKQNSFRTKADAEKYLADKGFTHQGDGVYTRDCGPWKEWTRVESFESNKGWLHYITHNIGNPPNEIDG